MRPLSRAALLAVLTAGILVAARRWLTVIGVDGSSMEPAYRDGERVLAVRPLRPARIRRGTVIVCRRPDRPDAGYLIKRVVATPGQPVPPPPPGSEPYDTPDRTPEGTVWVQGDSPGLDSRAFGPLPVGLIVARVVATLRRAPR